MLVFCVVVYITSIISQWCLCNFYIKIMKKNIYVVIALGLIFILNGCTNKENNKLIDDNLENDTKKNFVETGNIESVKRTTTDKEVDNNEKLIESNETDLSTKLGKVEKDNNEQNGRKKEVVECEDGFVYNTQLEKCFKNGNIDGSSEDNAEIDPEVQDCVDKGGIYNAQVEKCFVD